MVRRLVIYRKLLGLGHAADGPQPNGISMTVLISYTPSEEPDEVRKTVKQLVQDPNEPVEEHRPNTYRLTSISEGKEAERRLRPLIYWTDR